MVSRVSATQCFSECPVPPPVNGIYFSAWTAHWRQPPQWFPPSHAAQSQVKCVKCRTIQTNHHSAVGSSAVQILGITFMYAFVILALHIQPLNNMCMCKMCIPCIFVSKLSLGTQNSHNQHWQCFQTTFHDKKTSALSLISVISSVSSLSDFSDSEEN